MQLFASQLVQWTQFSWKVKKFGPAPATDVVWLSASDMMPSWAGLNAAWRRSSLISSTPCRGIWVFKQSSYSHFVSKVLSHCPVIPVLLTTQCPRKGRKCLPTQHPHPTVSGWLGHSYTGSWDGLKALQAKTCSWGYFRPSPLGVGCYNEGGNQLTERIFHWL